jgi:predicted dehydrogenase
MTEPLTVAIVGAGNIAGGFDVNRQEDENGVYSHAGAYRAHGGFSLETVFDPVVERAESFRNAWRVRQVALEFEEILQGFHDVISLCSPDETHFEYLESILSARCCRTVFAEKPLALRLGEIDRIIELAERSSINVVCNFQRRFEPEHVQLRRRIAEDPQKLLSATGHYMKGLRHIGTTMLDTLTFVCGYPEAALTYNRVNREISELADILHEGDRPALFVGKFSLPPAP